MAYATVEQVEAILGDDFNPKETEQAQAILDAMVVVIAGACDQPADWVHADPVPAVFTATSVAVTGRAMKNPAGASSEGETLGAYQHSTSFAESASGGPVLSRREYYAVRRGYFGSNVAAPRVRGTIDDVLEEIV